MDYFLSSSSSSCSSDLENNLENRNSVKNIMDVIEKYTFSEFKSHFRLNKSQAPELKSTFKYMNFERI